MVRLRSPQALFKKQARKGGHPLLIQRVKGFPPAHPPRSSGSVQSFTFSVLVGVPGTVRGSGEPRNELVILTLDLLSYVTDVAPPFRPRLSVWTRITVRALKFCVRRALISTFDVEIVKRAMN